MVIKTKKHVKCPIVKPSDIKISAKNLSIQKKYLDCINSNCTNFLEKDIKINEKCLDKTSHIKLYDAKRVDCYNKNGFIKNSVNKMKCEKAKCLKEVNNYGKIEPSQKLALTNMDASEFSFYNKEKKRLHEKEVQIYPELEKMTKILKEIGIIKFTILKCKDESEKKKLDKKMDRLLNKYVAIQMKNK
jgi:hypothetical protein